MFTRVAVEVDAEEVWATVPDHLPRLRAVVEQELAGLGCKM
jgi:uncharacterized protein with HEPN domain